MKKYLVATALLIGAGTTVAAAMSINANADRRTFLTKSAAAAISTAGTTSGLIANVNANAAEDSDPYADFIVTESGMKYKIIKEGDGAIPLGGQTVRAHYTGWLDGFDSIRKFDSSRDRGRPFSFKVGAGQVIRGWDESFGTMKVGERRQIILPPRLAYGDRGAGGIIPGGATLYFDVELLSIL
eukprot:CAMPEP_0196812712 /NCGR_PEP_ID=MMETSP1362-20130617/29758_1 /TAXON_ID=163516 /ORGANISM="Leptocylindrus danicus, Strain CCMP1856" /LENGTH=183 /DNA_ID=CAMNT_0042188531 /DNA_START=65 /DNA_END=616 /DNA_ORIENTATION=+